MLIATALTLAVLGFLASLLAGMVRQEGDKIIAALQGRSWTSQPPAAERPVTVRFSQQRRAAEPAWRELRAAA
jgi:hypothetical protein